MKQKKTKLMYSLLSLLLCLSMLVGTTFAWFTDSVVTGINTIAAGNLDVELYHTNAAAQDEKVESGTELFLDLQGDPILWEPGVVSYENLRVVNAGDLALAYQLSIATEGENYVVDPATGAQYGLSQILKVGFVKGGITATEREAVIASVDASSWTTLDSFLRSGRLLPEGAGESEEIWGVVICWQPGENDNLWNLNNGKTLNEGDVLNINLGVNLIATQNENEFDNFGNDYDGNAAAEFFPGFQGGSAAAVVTPDDQGLTTAAATMDGGDVAAVIPAGVQVADGANSMALSVTMKSASEANIQLGESEEMRPLDVHIEGVAEGNTVPMLITLKHYLSTGINTGALKLYHVENGATVAMTQVAAPANHNEFSYDPATGDLTLALASFSEVAVVADTNNPWDGTTRNYLWYNADATELTIYNADQLAGFADIVDGTAEGIAQDSFASKTVKLANNIYLSGQLFDPIGWGYVNNSHNRDSASGKVFQGTFDGGQYKDGQLVGRYTIFDLYQSGWDLEAKNGTDYTYTNCGFGLFAAASGATFQNLTISGAYVRAECVEMGVLVGLSQNSCTYNNIKILDSKIANYQRPAGGLIGEVSGAGTTTISNVVIGDDVVVGSLWGDFDAPCGGVIGARWDDANANPQIVMTDVEVGARLDVYNDITSAYQWHAYRRAGMLIGNTELTDPNNAHKAAAPFLSCTDVNVYYGDWVNYTYCEFNNHNSSYPWVRTQEGENCDAFSNPRWGVPNDAAGNRVTNMNHVHQEGDECNVSRPFGQLYGGGQGVYGQDTHDGVTFPNSHYSITYVNDSHVLDIIYVTNNANAVKVANDQAKKLVDEWATENMKDYNGFKFGGWMTAASVKLTEIPKDNTQNVVLYPYFTSPYTASFVDVDSNILAWCFFNEVNVDNLPATFATAKQNRSHPGDSYELDYWIIRGTDTRGNKLTSTDVNGKTVNYIVLSNENTNWESFKGYKDVTITPHYKYKGVDLIEVYDELTGEIDHYEAAGYGSGVVSTVVKIPGSVNGKDVTQINANAFSSYDGLHVVVIPKTVDSIGKKAISDQGNLFAKQETVTIYYEGSYDEWKSKNYGDDWITGLSEDTRVFFLNGGDTVDPNVYLQVKQKIYGIGSFSYISDYSFEEKTNAAGLVSEYYANCDCKVDGCKGNLRPDANYWAAYAN